MTISFCARASRASERCPGRYGKNKWQSIMIRHTLVVQGSTSLLVFFIYTYLHEGHP